MDKLNEKDFIKMANKIYIEPTKEVLDHLAKEYEEIAKALDNLNQIDVSNVKPTVRLANPIIYLREDQEDKSILLNKKVVLENAKEKNDDYVIIKRIFK